MIWNKITEWPVSMARIQFESTKPTAMTVIKPQICPIFSSIPIDKINNISDKIRKVYHSHLRVVERSCTHDKDKIVS